jgi:hypothetical protein
MAQKQIAPTTQIIRTPIKTEIIAPPSAPTVIVAIVQLQLPWKADAKRGRLCALNSVLLKLSAIASVVAIATLKFIKCFSA